MRHGVPGWRLRVCVALPPVLALLLSCGSGTQNTADAAIHDTGPGAPLSIATDNLPPGMVDVKYHAALSSLGGLRPLSWRISAGSLPSGLSLNPTTGAIDGTPTLEGQYPVTVEASDSGIPPQVATKEFTIRIQPRPGPVSITTTSLPGAQVGVAYSATLEAAGGAKPYAWSVESGTLPDGLRLIFTQSGTDFVWTIVGTPKVVGTWNFVVRVNDSLTPSQTASQPLSIVVAPPPPIAIQTTSLPNGVVGEGYAAALTATGGLPPYAWVVVAGSLPAGLSLPTVSNDGGIYNITGTPTTAGTSTFTVRVYDTYTPANRADKQLSITVNLPPQEDAGVQEDAAQSDVIQSDVIQSDVIQSDIIQSDIIQTDVQEDAAQEDAPPDA